MKKLLLTLALCLPFALCAPLTAFAAEETAAEELPAGEEQEGEEESFGWARITKEGVYLYRSADESSGLFILPRSYFVKITGEAGSFYAAEYLSGEAGRTAVRGYVAADEVTLVDYTPSEPYLHYSVDVTFTAGEGAGLPGSFISEYTLSAPFYGTFPFGSSTYYYVEIDGAFGYVPASACTALDYPLNTEHTQTPAPEQPTEEVQPAESSLSTASIVLLCLLGAAALAALVLIFRPQLGKKKAPEEAGEFYQG